MKGFVYILQSLKDNKQYIGSTIDFDKRFKEHNSGIADSTKNRRPFVLKYLLEFKTIEEAARMEKKFKHSHGALQRELKNRGIAQG